MLVKLYWLMINFFKHKFNVVSISKDTSKQKCTICVLIEYENFSGRDVKTVGDIEYTCGKAVLDLVASKCYSHKIPVFRVTTTDNAEDSHISDGDFLFEARIKNRGTDISALEDVIDNISDYQNVLFCNSSAPLEQVEKYIDNVFFEIQKKEWVPRIIGLNGNSRPSPALPFFHVKFPHIISNFFYANVQDIKNVLEIGKSSFHYEICGGYGNKYFAIRYFETLLSAYILKKGGHLCCIQEVSHYFPNDKWFKKDSRVTSMSLNKKKY